MSKCYIEFKKVKDKNGNINFKNIKLKTDGLFIKRTFKVDKEDELINDLKNNTVNYEKKNNSRVITDKDTVLKYSKKANEVLKTKKYKKVIFTAATISALAAAALSSKESKQPEEPNNIQTEATIDNVTEEEPVIYVNNVKSAPTEEITTEKEVTTEMPSTEEITTENTNYTFEFDYDDRSNDEYLDIISNQYGEYINKYSDMYGIDKNLVTAIIVQENKLNVKNYGDVGGYGLMQVESIWDGQELYSYNFETNDYEKIVVDTQRARDDDEYAIKVGCMIYNNYYQYIRSNYCINENKLTEEECIIAALFAYNKGIGTIMSGLDNYSNFETFINDIRVSSGGDDKYIEHVLSYENGKTITNRNQDGTTTSIDVKNKNEDLSISM